MGKGAFLYRAETFFKNDIYTLLVALAVVLVASTASVSAMAEDVVSNPKTVSEQLITSVNINTANAPLLAASLKGIGMKKAEAIVAWRSQNGEFINVDQLVEVRGIGPATIEKNRGRIVL